MSLKRETCTGLSGLSQITDYLFLSNARAASDVALLTRNGITCVISVTETAAAPPPGVELLHIPVSDSPSAPLGDYFDQLSERIRATAQVGGRTLVHCNAGVSRSASVCMAYLVRHRGASLLEAHQWVKKCRAVARPNAGFWKQLIRYEQGVRGCTSVRMVSTSMGEVPHIYEEESRNMMPL
ncbi:dual specificity protein phosphatase 18-like [Synchiropus splendidus]|uniref:dual specificity protein phosphatase 18-like n=1 Tax=Synchiropus splendidus TaxID=270530 RepID=UPI00237E4E2F|nr:dual specificity protein phosphatase 18-like [Synchiropus splendidus]